MPRTKRHTIAIVYDFDGTLTPGNMQERNFIPDIGLKAAVFWDEVKRFSRAHDMDEILAYLYLMLKKAKEKDVLVNKQAFVDYGKKIEFFEGVEKWFPLINKHAHKTGAIVEHHIISSGLREMIEGTAIRKYIKNIFGSGYCYDLYNVAMWPALAVNYTNKAQYLFRINKGINNAYDNKTINKYTPDENRPIPFENMIYIGDGETDIPAMKMTTYKGGLAIAVYPPQKKGARAAATKLIQEDRAAAAFSADYRRNSKLYKAVTSAIDSIVAKCNLRMATKIKLS